RQNKGVKTKDTAVKMWLDNFEQHQTVCTAKFSFSEAIYVELFFEKCAKAGVDSVLIADVPLRESAPFKTAATAAGIQSIYIAPPNGSPQTLQTVAEQSEGYTYLLSRAGVTGTESKVQMPVNHLIDTLKENSAPPLLLGFGISTPNDAKQGLASGADGIISGSAVVKIIEKNINDNDAMLNELTTFISAMKAATI
ncbi:MAG: tryptophan synthase subunit alpha, partial [Psychrobium sp.]